MKDQFQKALDSGYSEQEILNFLKKNKPETFDKYQEAVKEGYSPSQIFEFLGERKRPSAAKEVLTEAVAAPPTGFLGAYGNIQELISRLLGVEQPLQTESQQMMSQLEATVPESILPFLTEDDISLPISRLPRTQELREKIGVEEPETFLGGLTKRAGETVGGAAALPGGFTKGLLTRAPIAGAGGELVKQAGGGPIAQTLAETLLLAAPSPKSLAALKAKPVPSETGIKIPQAATKTKPSKILKPLITESRKEKLLKTVTDDAEKLIGDIKQKEFPISKKIEQGIDVSAENNAALKRVQAIADRLPEEIESNFISDYLNDVKAKIRESPVPSSEKATILKRIDNDFLPKYEATDFGTRFYKPKEYVKQFRDINSDLKSIYETNLVYGKRPATISFNEGLKDAIEKTLEAGTPKKFSNLFKETNKTYSQTKYLDRFNQIFEKLETDGALDPKKYSRFLKNPKQSRELRKLIGKDSFQRLNAIEKDVSKATNAINSIETTNAIKEVSGIIKSGLVGAIFKMLGIQVALPYKIGITAMKRAYGYILTQPQAQRDIGLFLNALKSGKKDIIRRALIKLDANLQAYEKESEL